MKKTWEGINELINNKKRKHKGIASLRNTRTQQISYNSSDHADILNSYFASVDPNLADKIPDSAHDFSEYLPINNFRGSFVFETVLHSELECEIASIPYNKAHGLYSCPSRLLKCASYIYIYIYIKPLSTIINCSVQRGRFPSKLKHAFLVIIDLYLYYQSLIESLKNLCTIV